MDGKTELKYAIIVFAIYVSIFLLLKLVYYFQFDDKESNKQQSIEQERLIAELDGQQRMKMTILKMDGAFFKMDSARKWINEHLDSIYPGFIDSIEATDYRHLQLQHLNTKLKRQVYTLDCLEFKRDFLDSHIRILGLSQLDSIRKFRDSLAKTIIHEKEDEIANAKMSIKLGELLLEFIYLPLILLFPVRWLLNFFRKR